MSGYQLAELNIAEAFFSMDDERMHGFTSRIHAVNALADQAPGFVWRLVDEDTPDTGAIHLRPFTNPNMLVNMSIWQDVPSLYDFVYKTVHAKVMKGKPKWFAHLKSHSTVMWWVKTGHVPTLVAAKEKLTYLDTHGASEDAFTFKDCYTPLGQRFVWNMPEKDCA